ncbi:MAG TPA: tetratricopeptide repeat protein, partial [bacterium]|nr:tetratricopeptide repeat protein [bacterium]
MLAVAACLTAGGCRPARDLPSEANAVTHLKRLQSEFQAEPQNLEKGVALAKAYHAAGQADEAEAIYTGFLGGGTEASQGLAMNLLAQFLHEEGRTDEAVTWLLRSTGIGTSQTQSHAWFLLGDLVRTTGEVPAALREPVREGEPPLAAEGMPATEVAAIAYRKAINTGSAAPEVFRGLAELQLAAGDRAAALENYQI